VASVLALTESEAKVFWPVYNAYQATWSATTIGPQAHRHLRQGVRHDDRRDGYDVAQPGPGARARSASRCSILTSPRFRKVLRPKRSRACNQVENKIRALVNYELARDIPFVK